MEALPIGNGRIGGMVYGDPSIERLDLTESTAWSGAPSDKNMSPTAFENLERIRELIFAGKYVEAGELRSILDSRVRSSTSCQGFAQHLRGESECSRVWRFQLC
jgi:hypothetical protein